MSTCMKPMRNVKHVLTGRQFEAVTNIEPMLYTKGYTKQIFEKKSKYGYLLASPSYNTSTNKIQYFTQAGLKLYSKKIMNVTLNRHPDECYICSNNKITLKILEKKTQHAMGSVDTKLYAAPLFIDEYMERFAMSGIHIDVKYAFCLNSFFKSSKYSHIFKRLEKYDIPVFFGEDETYCEEIFQWIQE